MKNRLIISIGTVLVLVFFFFENINVVEAESKSTGKWVAVYDGGSSPSYWECVYSFWFSECIVGDTRTSDPNAPIKE